MFKSIQRDDDLFIPKKKEKESPKVIIKKKVATCLKNVDHRFSMHVSTDKHQYKPEETVHIRGILLNEFSHMPAMKRFIGETFNFRIVGPSGAIVYGGDNVNTPSHQKSVVAYDWKIPADIPGGSYMIEIGKQYYDKGEMKQDEGQAEDGDVSVDEAENEEFDLYPGSSAFCQIDGSSVTRIGRNGWKCMVRKKVTKTVQKFKIKVDHSGSDRSGIFLGLVGENVKNTEIWKCCSVNDKWGNPEIGSTYEFEVDQKNNQCKMWKNGVYLGENNSKIRGFKKPLYIAAFLHYAKNKVTFTGESKGGFFPVATRKFDILKYTPPKFKMDLDFPKKGFGPSDTVNAILKVERREGGVPPSCQIEATCRLDGAEIFKQGYTCTTGTQFINFKLPDVIVEGNGSLNCSVTEGVTENISKTIPIILRKIDCKVYPEGGELIMGLPNGVYVEAKTLYGSPVHFEGFLMEKDLLDPSKVRPVCEVKTLHEGRGSFQFTPMPNKEYSIRVLKPEGVVIPVELPEIKKVGMTIRLTRRRSAEFGQLIEVGLAATRTIETRLGLYKKDKIVDMTDPITINQGDHEKVFSLNPKDVDGVLRLTAFFVSPDFGVNDLIYPICERLIMVKPKEVLDIKIESKQLVYTPGEQCSIRVIPRLPSTGQQNIPTLVCCTVTDDSVVEMLEKRKRPPRLIEQVYLENEVSELKDCSAYINREVGNVVDPDLAADLLLGTQGWRRFVYIVQAKNPKFYEEDEKYKEFKKEFFYRMLNLPNPEYFERKKKNKILKIVEPDYSDCSSSDEECEGEEEFEDDGDYSVPLPPLRMAAKSSAKSGSRGKGKRRIVRKEGMKKEEEKSDRDRKKVFTVDKFTFGKKKKKKLMKESSKIGGRFRRTAKVSREESVLESIPLPEMAEMEQSILPPVPPMMGGEGISLMDYDDDEICEDEIDIGYFSKKVRKPRKPKPIIIPSIEYAREYAYAPRPDKPQGVRDDFTETILFSPYKETYPDKNQQVVDFTFHLSDSITSYVVRVDAFSLDGMIGSSNSFKLVAQKPFFILPKLPLEISMADEVRIPTGIVNNLPLQAKCSVEWVVPKDTQLEFRKPNWNGTIAENERKVEYFDMKVKGAFVKKEKQKLSCHGVLTDFAISDTIEPTISVQPYGFLTCQPFSGVLQKDEDIVIPFKIDPKTYVPGSLETVGYVVPSSLGNFMTAVKGLIREPYGCFEQVSSTMYPMIMAKQFLIDQQQPMDPKIDTFLKKGYDKLMGYEISGGGFDWYGSPPANESLTAMGLVQFIELQRVFSVDPNVIGRTKDWLLSRKTNDGFLRSSGRYAYGHAKKNSTNAYILWSISRSLLVGFEEIESVITSVHQNGVTTTQRKNDNYVTALLSLAYFNYGKAEEANALAMLLVPEQQADGSLISCEDTITRSGGRNRNLEITALSCLAWMNLGAQFQAQTIKGIDYILKNNRSGCYGSTQSTVLCLQAIIKYFGGRQDSDGYIELEINEKSKQEIEIPKYQNKQVEFGKFGDLLHVADGSENKIVIRNRYGNTLPYSVAVWYKITVPPIEQETLPFRFSTSMGSDRMKEGGVTEINVELVNLYQEDEKDADLPMIIAIVSVPSGLTPRNERLKELQKMGVFDYYELFGARNVVFYWRGMAPKEVKKFAFEVAATIPGKFIGDASRAYLYYDNDLKFYVKGLEVEIDTRS